MRSDELENDSDFFGLVAEEPPLKAAMESKRLGIAHWGKRPGNAVMIITRLAPAASKGSGEWDLSTPDVTNEHLNVHFEIRSRTELRLDRGFGSRTSASKVYEDLEKRDRLSLFRMKERVYEELERKLSDSSYEGHLRPVPVESRPKGVFARGGNQSVLKYPFSNLRTDSSSKLVAEFFAEVICGTSDDIDAVIAGLKSGR